MGTRLKLSVMAAAALLSATAAQAQYAGTLVARIGATQISPDVTSGDLTTPAFAGTKADIKSNLQPTGGVTWMWNDDISVDIPLALGFTHEIVGDGAIAGVGKIGEVKALPITLLLQYRFGNARSPVRPYIGAGPTYARFYKARSTAALSALTGGTPTTPTTLSVESKWAATVQLGVSVAINSKWSVDAAVLKTKLSTRTTLSTGQTLDAKLDPTSVTVGLGYAF